MIVGNVDGILINDAGSTPATTAPVSVINDDFAFNTIGIYLQNTASTPLQAYIASNIFWENHDQTSARNGYAIESANPNMVNLRNNLFQGDGPSDSFTSDPSATNNLGNGFSATALNNVLPDSQGNFVGRPAFVFPIDPRPGADGPANLFVSSNFDLTASSAAIDNAYEPTAIATDILGNSQVNLGDGWGLPNDGPRDIGAFEFDGTGGNTVGGAFRVVTTSLVPVGGAYQAAGGTLVTATSPTSVTLTFSGNVNPSTLKATDLLLSGSADNAASPIQATSLTWVDAHTVRFNLSSPLSLPGTLNVSLAPGMFQGMNGQSNLGYQDSVVLQLGTPKPQPNPTPYPIKVSTPTPVSTPPSTPTSPTAPPTTVTSLPLTPPPAAAPTSAKGHSKVKHKPVKVTHKHVAKPKHPATKHVTHAPAHKPVVKHVNHAATHKPVVKHTVKPATVHPKATTSVHFFFTTADKKKK